MKRLELYDNSGEFFVQCKEGECHTLNSSEKSSDIL